MVGSCHHNTLRNSNVVLLTRSAIGAWNTASFRCKNVCRTATKLTFVVQMTFQRKFRLHFKYIIVVDLLYALVC